ncbi:hypothetical protein HanXRQr2_Chr09g0365501 [Helianthus annuus]|uniref:Uncharacterized protein n=1 Tax=Helianthus annuus TaxID=4232 RepID=A0A9K3I243_HELAN|nr:hypothetical protein HanXRQr2_Chr09g0365501 [Helianthus annuus]KAJ0891307.1 hypothetical protein HanPSC8_Chr09g0352191 [Helianthus annuus]
MITTGIIVYHIYYGQNIHSLNVGVSNEQPVEIPIITKHELTSILQTSLQHKCDTPGKPGTTQHN